MPEGFRSIDDLLIVVDASTAPLREGLQQAQGIVASFSESGATALGLFDTGVQKVNTSVLALKASLGWWITAAETVLALMEKLGTAGDKAAKAFGADEEWNALKGAVDELKKALGDDLTQAYDSAKNAARDYAQQAIGNSIVAGEQVEQQKSFLGIIDEITAALHRASIELRSFSDKGGWNLDVIGEQIKRSTDSIKELQDAIEKTKASGVGWWDAIIGNDAEGAIARMNARIREHQGLLVELDALKTKRTWSEGAVVDSTNYNLLDGLDREIASLKLKAATLDMTTAASAAYLAQQRFMAELSQRPGGASDSLMAEQAARVKTIGELTQKLNDHAEAQKLAKQDAADDAAVDREIEQQEKLTERTIGAMEKQTLQTLKRREELVPLTVATAAQAAEEATLLQLRERGIDVSDADIVRIKAQAQALGEARVALQQAQQQMQAVNQVGSAVTKGLETAFERWTTGAKLGVKDMAASVILDLEKITLRAGVMKPIENAFSSSMGSLLGLTGLSGARADGGPVDGGSTYLVGERGPELFRPSGPGSIVPNHQLASSPGGGGSGGGSQPITIVNTIDARGAYPESIADIRQALADHQAALPGKVLEVVGDARERGG